MSRVVMCGVALLLSGCGGMPAATGRVVEESLHAAGIDEDYRLQIRLPPEYDTQPAARFPVVIQLDPTFAGLQQFALTSGFASALEEQQAIGPAIVVGVGYRYDESFLPAKGRWRDYSFAVPTPVANPINDFYGFGAEAFHRFVRDELMPHLDAGYRLSGRRALVGHSLGGLFVLYALFQYDPARAPLFSDYLAASPSTLYEDGALFDLEAALATRTPSLPARLYLAIGGLEVVPSNVYFDELARRLRGRVGLSLSDVRFDGAGHLDVIPLAFHDGLAALLGAQQ